MCDAGAAVGGSSLDLATLTVLCRPTCGEASARVARAPSLQSPGHTSSAVVRSSRKGTARRGNAVDPVRSREEADRRARARIRRWAVHNRASRLGTLTYREPVHDYHEVWTDLERFRRLLGEHGFSDSVCLVPEAHPGPVDSDGVQCGDSHGWHVHLAVARYVPQALLVALWKQATPNAGYVDIRKVRARVRGVRPGAPGGRSNARVTARYLAKTLAGYVTKDASGQAGGGEPAGPYRPAPTRPMNAKRFSLAKGSTVPEVRFTVIFPKWAEHEISNVCGFRMWRVWESPPDWDKGPPISLWEG